MGRVLCDGSKASAGRANIVWVLKQPERSETSIAFDHGVVVGPMFWSGDYNKRFAWKEIVRSNGVSEVLDRCVFSDIVENLSISARYVARQPRIFWVEVKVPQWYAGNRRISYCTRNCFRLLFYTRGHRNTPREGATLYLRGDAKQSPMMRAGVRVERVAEKILRRN